MWSIRQLGLALALTLCLPAFAAGVHDAGRTVRIVVGFPAGGTTDFIARLIADQLKDDLGHPVIVENRPGAAGRVAATTEKNAAPDGDTILLTPFVVPVLAPLVFGNVGFLPEKHLAPVSQVATYQYGLAVAASHPAHTVPEFIAWVRAHPSRANYGTLGVGTAGHILGAELGRASGATMVHIPYSGKGSLGVDLLGQRVAADFDALSNLVELHREGKIRILATSGAHRFALLPEVPTFGEQGFPGLSGSGWIAAYVPAGTPADVIARLSKSIAHAVRQPEIAAKLRSVGLEPTGTTPQELASIMAADTAYWRPLVRSSGLLAE
ncbi:MAG: Twin-arginine translocation pathway signal [Burkholderiales bacterium]|nr:Twin-arginine translocation pathway signal [Burkholderiales bacterium]